MNAVLVNQNSCQIKKMMTKKYQKRLLIIQKDAIPGQLLTIAMPDDENDAKMTKNGQKRKHSDIASQTNVNMFKPNHKKSENENDKIKKKKTKTMPSQFHVQPSSQTKKTTENEYTLKLKTKREPWSRDAAPVQLMFMPNDKKN